MTSSEPHFLTFCPNRKWTTLPNLFLIMSILSWLHFLSESLICNIPSDSADPVLWSSLLEVTLPQLCLARACPTDVNAVEWRMGSNPTSFCVSLRGAKGGGCCSPRGRWQFLPLYLCLLTTGAQANHLNGFLMQLRNMKSTKAWDGLKQ